MEIGAKQYDKEGFFFGRQNIEKADAQKWASPVLESGLQQQLRNTYQLPWHASLVRKRSVISMLLAA